MNPVTTDPAPSLSPADSRAVPFLDPAWTVREVVQRYPASVAIFKAWRVEACCDAGRPLADAAAKAGVPLETLLGALRDGLAETT